MLPKSKVILWETLTIFQHFDQVEDAIILTSKEELRNYLENPQKTETLILDYAYNVTVDHLLVALGWEKWAQRLIVAAFPMPAVWLDLFPKAAVYKIPYHYNSDVYYYTDTTEEQLSNLDSQENILIIDGEPTLNSRFFDTNYRYIFDEMLTEIQEPTLTGGVRRRLGYLSQDVYEARIHLSERDSVTFRHISKEDFQKLPRYFTSDIFTMPLHQLMLELYRYNYSPYKSNQRFDHDRSSGTIYKVLLPLGFAKKDIDFVYSLLISQKIISMTNKVLKNINTNLGLRPALIAETAPHLAACIDCYREGIFKFLTRSQGPTHEYQIDNLKYAREKYVRFQGLSDCETLLNIYNGSLNQDLSKWANDNALSLEYLRDLHQTVLELTGQLQPVNVEEELARAQPIIEQIYADQRLDLDWERTVLTQYYVGGKNFNISETSINLIEQERPAELYALITYRVGEVDTIAVNFVPNE